MGHGDLGEPGRACAAYRRTARASDPLSEDVGVRLSTLHSGSNEEKKGGGGEREKEMRSGTAEPTVVDEPDAPVEIELQALADGEEVEAVLVAAVRQHRRDVREDAVVEERDDLLGLPVLVRESVDPSESLWIGSVGLPSREDDDDVAMVSVAFFFWWVPPPFFLLLLVRLSLALLCPLVSDSCDKIEMSGAAYEIRRYDTFKGGGWGTKKLQIGELPR